MTTCRHECECPSQLHHDVSALIARLEAPIPTLTPAQIASELHTLVEEDVREARKG